MRRYLKHILLGVTKGIKPKLTEAELFVLRVLCGSTEQARASWQAYRNKDYDVDTLYLSSGNGLLPSLAKRLTQIIPEDPWLGKLRGYYKHTWTRNQLQLARLSTMLKVLSENGIESIILNDAAILLSQYGDIAMRPISVQGVLVKQPDFQRARSLLHVPAETEEGIVPLAVVRQLPGALQRSVWQDAVRIELAGSSALCLAVHDLLLLNLLSVRYEDPNQPVWFLDMSRLTNSCCEEDVISRFVARVSSCRLAVPVTRAWSFFEQVAGQVHFEPDRSVADAVKTLPISAGELKDRFKRKLGQLRI